MNTTDNYTRVSNITNGRPPKGYFGDTRVMMWKIIPPIIISIGTFGNILTMIVLLRQIKRLSSTSMFLLTLAFSDTVILWCGPFSNWIRVMWQIDIRKLSDISCKLQLYLTYVSIHMSSWLLVAVTMERVLSVIIPHRIKLLCTPTKASIVIVITMVLVFAVDIIIPISTGLDGHLKGIKCTPTTKEYFEFREYYFNWIDICVTFACPFIFLLIGNILILVKLAKSHSNRVKMNATRGQTKSARKGRSLMVLLVSLCFVFFLTMSPVSIYQIWYPYRFKEILAMADPYAQYDAYQYLLFLHSIVNIVGYTNASTNFLLYVFYGSKFRGELKALFYCKTSKRNGVFGSGSRQSFKQNTHAYTPKSYENVFKLSSEHNQCANKSSVVSYSISDGMQLFRNVHKNMDGQGQLVGVTNNRQGNLNNAFNTDDGINQVSIFTCTDVEVKEQTKGTSEDCRQKFTTIADIVTENDPDDVPMST